MTYSARMGLMYWPATARRRLWLVVMAIALWACSSAAFAAGDGSFYAGKTLTITVPTSPGGHFDRFARLVAHYLPKHLPVDQVKVVNRPGGGMLTAGNAVYRAKPDGLTIGIANAAGYVFSQLQDRPGVNFDVSKFAWIGRPDDDPLVLNSHKKGPYKTFADLMKLRGNDREVTGLAVGKGGFAYNAEVATLNAFGVPFRMVAAFQGSHQLVASYLSGNGDIIPLSASSAIEHLASSSNMLLVVSDHKIEQLPNVPTALAEAKQYDLKKSDLAVLKALVKVLGLGRSFYAPPGVPADRLQALRQAFKQTIEDPATRKQASKSGLFLGYAPPDKLQQIVKYALTADRQQLQQYLKER